MSENGLLFKSKVAQIPNYYNKKAKAEYEAGRKMSNAEFEEKYLKIGGGSTLPDTGTSIFDPALCETIYVWFTAKDDFIIDPFAGGSVRGIVAVEMGRHYCGVDLRQEQIDANIENAEICTDERPTWICGDSVNIDRLAKGEYDFIMTCPPYGNLEVYSDDPADISNMDDESFDRTYADIMHKTVDMLKENRFACVVVGNYRDKNGNLRDLVGRTVAAMESAGAHYYNDIILITPAGSLPMRAGKAFNASRKVGRTHQYVLIFVKGDGKEAAKRLGEIDLSFLEEYQDGGEDDG